MDLNDIRGFINIILRDYDPEKMNMSPQQFTELLNVCSLLHFKKKVGLPEEYRPGVPIPKQAVEITKKIAVDMNMFKVTMGEDTVPLSVDQYGHALLPADCYYPLAFAFRLYRNGSVDFREIDWVNSLEWWARKRNSITKPSQKYPIVEPVGWSGSRMKLRFDPVTLGRVDVTYLKYPTPAVFGYTLFNSGDTDAMEGDEFIRYNASTSTQLEWDDINIIDIISLFMERLGVKIARQDIIQYSNKVNTTGT